MNDCKDCEISRECTVFSAPAIQAVLRKAFYGRTRLVFQEGKAADKVVMVQRGWLRMSHVTASGKVVSTLVRPGTILGVPEVMTGTPLSRSVETLQESVLEWVEAGAFLSILDADPRLAVEVLKKISGQILDVAKHHGNPAAKLSSDQRLLLTLREISRDCAAPSAHGDQITLPLSMQDLAEMVGCSRQWVWKLLGDLEVDGHIRRRGGWITMLNPAVRSRRRLAASGRAGTASEARVSSLSA